MSSTTRPLTPRKLSELMTSDPISVRVDIDARKLARVLDANGLSGVPVVDGLGCVVGVVSKTELIHRCLEGPAGSRGGAFLEFPEDGRTAFDDFAPEDLGVVEDFMNPEPVTAKPDEPVGVIARRMAAEGVHRVIVTGRGGALLGVVTSLGFLREFPAASGVHWLG